MRTHTVKIEEKKVILQQVAHIEQQCTQTHARVLAAHIIQRELQSLAREPNPTDGFPTWS